MSSRPYVVVTGSDFSEHAGRALVVAYEQALRHAPAELHVVHATLAASMVDSSGARHTCELGASSAQSLTEQQAELVRHLDSQLRTLPGFGAPGVSIVAHVLVEAPMFAITHLASAIGADMIVVGSHGRHGIARWLLGSVAEAVVRLADCPVLVVPPRAHQLPAIEPPCPHCVAMRQAPGGEQWCDAHRRRHGRRHVYHQSDRVGADTNLPLVVR
jgi:nucleotide-binding universal stress UspA family protein